MDKDNAQAIFRFFTEVGIINQFSRAILEARLPDNLTITHFGIVSHLSRRPEGETPLQLATAFQVPKTSMTHMLKVLERLTLVTQIPNASDGRSKLIQITPKGRQFFEESCASFLPELSKISDQVGIETLTALLPDLERIRIVMDKFRDPKN